MRYAAILVACILIYSCSTPFEEIAIPPELLLPEDGAELYTAAPDLSWSNANCVSNRGECALNYIVLIDNQVVADITELVFTPQAGLESGEHTWSVKAQNYFQYSESETRTFTIRLKPGKPTLLAPTTTQSSSTPELQWTHVQNAAEYTVELSIQSDFSTLLITDTIPYDPELMEDSVSFTPDSLPDGTYYWRVTASDNTGLTTLSDTFILEINSQPSGMEERPILLTPTTNVCTSTPTFQWTSVQQADNYHIEVAADSDFTSIVSENASLTTTTFSDAGLSAGYYYWRVTAHTGSETKQSEVYSLQVKPISKPVGLSPSNTTSPSIDDSPVTYDWTTESGLQYTFELNTTSDFSGTLIHSNSNASPPYEPSVTYSTQQYYWRLIATDPTGCTAESDTFTFLWEECIVPGSITINNPSSPYSSMFTPPTAFEWTTSSPQASAYYLEFSLDSNFTSIDHTETVTGQTTFSPTYTQDATASSFLEGKHYYWRVKGEVGCGLSNESDTQEIQVYGYDCDCLTSTGVASIAMGIEVDNTNDVVYVASNVPNRVERYKTTDLTIAGSNLFEDNFVDPDFNRVQFVGVDQATGNVYVSGWDATSWDTGKPASRRAYEFNSSGAFSTVRLLGSNASTCYFMKVENNAIYWVNLWGTDNWMKKYPLTGGSALVTYTPTDGATKCMRGAAIDGTNNRVYVNSLDGFSAAGIHVYEESSGTYLFKFGGTTDHIRGIEYQSFGTHGDYLYVVRSWIPQIEIYEITTNPPTSSSDLTLVRVLTETAGCIPSGGQPEGIAIHSNTRDMFLSDVNSHALLKIPGS